LSRSPDIHRPAITGATWKAGLRAEIYDHVFSDLHHEVGGFLLGNRGDGGRLRVTGAVPASAADQRSASVTFTQDDWANVHAEVEARGSGDQIIGWYHSHPGFGIFLSEFDLFIHRNFFSDLGQIAYVVDPHAGREGLFGWRDEQVSLFAEGDTLRPGERPAARTADRLIVADRWRVKHYLPAVGLGAVVGLLAAIFAFGGANKVRSPDDHGGGVGTSQSGDDRLTGLPR